MSKRHGCSFITLWHLSASILISINSTHNNSASIQSLYQSASILNNRYQLALILISISIYQSQSEAKCCPFLVQVIRKTVAPILNKMWFYETKKYYIKRKTLVLQCNAMISRPKTSSDLQVASFHADAAVRTRVRGVVTTAAGKLM